MDTTHLHPMFRQLPQDWPVVRIDGLFTIQQGKQVSQRHRAGDRQRSFLRTKNVYWDRLDLTELDAMHFSEEDEERLRLRPGDLLTCEGGWVGRTAMWNNHAGDCLYQNHLHRLRRISCDTDPRFVLYWLWYAFDVGEVYFGRQNVTTIPNLSKSRLSELPMPAPKAAEQRQIARVLSAVQRAIERQERLIALTAELKKALMHQLFTEGTRGEPLKQTEIGPVPESWEVAPLAKFTESFQYGTSVKCGYEAVGSPVLRIPNVVGGHLDITDLKYGSPKRNELESIRLQSGDLLFVRTNGVKENAGRCSIYRGELGDMCYFASYLIRARLRTDLLPEFLEEYTRTETGVKLLSGRAIRTADGKFNINTGTLESFLVPKPSAEEQEQIANVVRATDRKARNHALTKHSLESLFRTLLHQLMTAQIRVDDLDLSALGVEADAAAEPAAELVEMA
jgi:type I restriction enzyme, S subunit